MEGEGWKILVVRIIAAHNLERAMLNRIDNVGKCSAFLRRVLTGTGDVWVLCIVSVGAIRSCSSSHCQPSVSLQTPAALQ